MDEYRLQQRMMTGTSSDASNASSSRAFHSSLFRGSADANATDTTDAENDEEAHYLLLKELATFLTHHNEALQDSEPSLKRKKIEVSVETERLLRDSAALLSESRPPPDFVVYADGTTTNHRIGTDATDGTAVNHASRPPIFDGGVANSTPPPLGGNGGAAGGGGGGAGTVLHLACALDVPLALAFLLAMGGDAQSSHTAFRRMMVHEAACNGSINCLTLLLELGHKFGAYPVAPPTPSSSSTKLRSNSTVAAKTTSSVGTQSTASPSSSLSLASTYSNHSDSVSSGSPPPPPPSSSPSSFPVDPFDLPFLPRRMDRAEALAPLQLYVRESGFFGRRVGTSAGPPPDPRSGPYREDGSSGSSEDFVSTLRLFREYARQVRDGALTELDAARLVLERACLTDESRRALARSCGFLAASSAPSLPSSSVEPTRNRLRPQLWGTGGSLGVVGSQMTMGVVGGSVPGGSSDGHGNTPLHWAAFKNEVDCVSLLLQYRADPNARAHPSGWTPLHDAAYSNSTETIRLLLDAGASVDARANSGATPLCFAAQEDAAEAAALLLQRGADLTTRCAGGGGPDHGGGGGGGPHSRFSGYTPLHYCAHYNADRAAHMLLKHPTAKMAMEVPDLSERLPIHVAVARGSSDVLRELLHAGARVETRLDARNPFRSFRQNDETLPQSAPATPNRRGSPPSPERRSTPRASRASTRSSSSQGGRSSRSATPVSSPILRSMIPAQPVSSSKPWNCLTQRSIDECRQLITEAEQSWTPDRHSLFTPTDRQAVLELLRVGKRLELQGTGIFLDLWPQVLSFCGRGWFEIERDHADGAESLSGSNADHDASAPNEDADDELDFVDRSEHERTDAAHGTDVEADDRLALPTF